jgi:hypothetical protein
MILFLADNHFKNHPGKHIYRKIKERYDISLAEDDLSPLNEDLTVFDLIVLHLIPGTPNSNPLDTAKERHLKAYVDSGRPLLILHGSSALLPGMDWWRELVGMRWVRGGDIWGVERSTHPHDPFEVVRTKNMHPLRERLVDFSADDELYINLEHTSPVLTLMEANWGGRSWTQCYVKRSPAGGKVAAFIPGHRQDIVESEAVISNICTLIDWCLEKN